MYPPPAWACASIPLFRWVRLWAWARTPWEVLGSGPAGRDSGATLDHKGLALAQLRCLCDHARIFCFFNFLDFSDRHDVIRK